MAADPITTFRVVAIHPSRPKRKGPTHGAATSPHMRPSTKAPRYPEPPALDRRLLSPAGSAISNAPKSEADSDRKTSAIPATTHGLPSMLPKPLPVSAETTPIGVKRATIPSTNVSESSIPSKRLLASFAPKTETVMAIIGYTQGVRLVASPNP